MKPLVLFDLDGTLVDTTDLILQSFAYTFDVHLPGRLPSRADLIATFGRSLPAALEEMAALNGAADPRRLGDEMLSTYREFQRDHHDTLIRPFDGIAEMLSSLQARGHRLGVVTSKMQHFARRGMRLFDLEDFFDVAVFHDDVTRHKPEPDPIQKALERMAAEPADAAYVGDSPFDIRAAKAAGVHAVAVAWGGIHSAEALEAEAPDALVRHAEELLAVL